MSLLDEAAQKKQAARHDATRQAARDMMQLAPPPGYADVLTQLQRISDEKAAAARRRKVDRSPATAELQLTAGEQHQRQREIAQLSERELEVFIEGLEMQKQAYNVHLEQLQAKQAAIVRGDYTVDAVDLSDVDDLIGGLGRARDELVETQLLPDLIVELQRRLKHVRFELGCARTVQRDRIEAARNAEAARDAAGRVDALRKALKAIDEHFVFARKHNAKPQMSGRLQRALRAEIERLDPGRG